MDMCIYPVWLFDLTVWAPCLFWQGLRKLGRKTSLPWGLHPRQVALYGGIPFSFFPFVFLNKSVPLHSQESQLPDLFKQPLHRKACLMCVTRAATPLVLRPGLTSPFEEGNPWCIGLPARLRSKNHSKKAAAAEEKERHSWFPFLPPSSRELIKAQSPVNKYETLPLSDGSKKKKRRIWIHA